MTELTNRFQNPDPLHNSVFKAKTERNKRRSMREAIGDAVHDGDHLVIEGFTHLIDFAAGHEIIRQRKTNLTATRLTPDLVYDQLLQAGLVRKLIFSWAGNPGVGSLHALRRLTESGGASGLGPKPEPKLEPKLELEEYSHFGMVARFLAGSSGLPFWPLHNYQGSDIGLYNSNIKEIECPYTGKKLATVPAIHPDVAVIHVQRADESGNAQIWGLMGTQRECAFASKRVIVVAEEIVPTSVIRSDPNRTVVPGILVDHVVHEPMGCHPSYAQGFYDRDNAFYVAWDAISRQNETYQNYLEEFVYGVPDRAAYVKKLETSTLQKLKAKSRMCQGVDYGY